MSELICKNCGKLFEADTARARYCSVDCRKEYHKKYDKKEDLAKGRERKRITNLKNKSQSAEESIEKAKKAIFKSWYDIYKDADRLTQDSMIAKELGMSYGELQVYRFWYPVKYLDKVSEIVGRHKHEDN